MLYYVSLAYYDYCYYYFFCFEKKWEGGGHGPLGTPGFAGPESSDWINSVDTERKSNVYKTSRRRPGRLLNVLCTFNLRPVSLGKAPKSFIKTLKSEAHQTFSQTSNMELFAKTVFNENQNSFLKPFSQKNSIFDVWFAFDCVSVWIIMILMRYWSSNVCKAFAFHFSFSKSVPRKRKYTYLCVLLTGYSKLQSIVLLKIRIIVVNQTLWWLWSAIYLVRT